MSFLPALRFLLITFFLPVACSSPGRKGLVEVRKTAPGVIIDLRYATAHNITGRPLYPRRMPCLLRASTAQRLRHAQTLLRAQGYGLKIWDAWRPLEAHQRLHDHGRETGLFLDPVHGWSRHCGGVAVDATLVDLKGREQRMPTAFDDHLGNASSQQVPDDPEIRRNLEILHQAMRGAGFKPLPGEWWHFDDSDFLHVSIQVITGKDLGVKIRGR